MKLKDFIINSAEYSLRSKYFVWHRCEVSAGAYEETSGHLRFVYKDGESLFITDNADSWFILDDESVVYDEKDKNNLSSHFSIWRYDGYRSSGSLSRSGMPLLIRDGWIVRLEYDAPMQKLLKVDDKAKSLRIEGGKCYVSRPYKDTDFYYDDVYDNSGVLDKEETGKQCEGVAELVRHEMAREAFEKEVSDIISYSKKTVSDFFTDLAYRGVYPEKSLVEIGLAGRLLPEYIKCKFLNKIKDGIEQKKNVYCLANMIANDEEYLWLAVDFDMYLEDQSMLDINDDFREAVKIYRDTVDSTIRILKMIRDDSSPSELIDIILSSHLMDMTFRFYGILDKVRTHFPPIEA